MFGIQSNRRVTIPLMSVIVSLLISLILPQLEVSLCKRFLLVVNEPVSFGVSSEFYKLTGLSLQEFPLR